jgi:hypothetical protein
VTSWPFTYNSLSPGHYFVRQYISWGGHGYVQVDYNQPSDYHCVGGSPAAVHRVRAGFRLRPSGVPLSHPAYR